MPYWILYNLHATYKEHGKQQLMCQFTLNETQIKSSTEYLYSNCK